MSEHNGSSYVTFRDLLAAMRDYTAELDRRFKDHVRQHESERSADQEALRLAREALAKALAQTNEFRAEATEDKQKYAELTWVSSEMAKLEQLLKSEFARDVQNISSRISLVASSGEDTATIVDKLQNASSTLRGRELGWRGALLVAMVSIFSIVVSVLSRIFLG